MQIINGETFFIITYINQHLEWGSFLESLRGWGRGGGGDWRKYIEIFHNAFLLLLMKATEKNLLVLVGNNSWFPYTYLKEFWLTQEIEQVSKHTTTLCKRKLPVADKWLTTVKLSLVPICVAGKMMAWKGTLSLAMNWYSCTWSGSYHHFFHSLV